jgi:hypothetical protein
MLSLKKPDVSVLETGCSGFCGFTDKTEWSDFPNWTVRFPKLDCLILTDLAYVYLNFNCCDPPASRITCSYTQNCGAYWMHRYRGSSLGFPRKVCKMASLGQI